MKLHNQHLQDENSQLVIESRTEINDQANLKTIDQLSQPGPKHISYFLRNVHIELENTYSEEDGHNVTNQNH